MSDDRDREIAELKAEVERLSHALEARPAKEQATDGPLFGHGLRGGYFGFLEVVIGTLALTILLGVVHHLTTPDPWRFPRDRGGVHLDPDGGRLP